MKIECNEKMLKEIIETLKNEALEYKKKPEKEWEDTDTGVMLGYYFCMTTIKNVISLWHPHDNEAEIQKIFEEIGIDFDLEQIFQK